MNIEDFREYCLSFKGVHEKMPFPNVPDKYSRDVLCFYVADKWFCFVNIEIFDFCCIKCNPDESGELQTEYAGIRPGWHMNKKYWISVYFNQDVPDEKIKELISNSYDIVVKSLTKKEREMLWFFVKFGGNLFFISTVFFFLNPIKSCRYVCFLVTLKTPHH